MNNEYCFQVVLVLQDKDESIYQVLMMVIVEYQLLLGSKLLEEVLVEVFVVSCIGIRKVL